MRIKIFCSDEGFGHIVRQRAIITELLKDGHVITLQTKDKIGVVKSFFGNKIGYVEKFNNIRTVKSEGALDKGLTSKTMSDYLLKFVQRVNEEVIGLEGYDLVISDLVPEAIVAGKILGLKTFGVCHHTWDWLFGKVFGDTDYVKLLEIATREVDTIFFPPFTPDEIIQKYNDKAVRVPFIVYPFEKVIVPEDKFNILVLDSGTNILKSIINKNKECFKELSDYNFIIPKEINKVHNLIPSVDLVISRAGFNTISDCIIAKTPMLLIDEPENPEIDHNLSRIKELGLCKVMSVNDYKNCFKKEFKSFMKKDYKKLRDMVKKYEFNNNGAQKICEAIKRCQ